MAGRKFSAAAQSAAAKKLSAPELCERLKELRQRLDLCRTCVVVVVDALRYQNADHDGDMAQVLLRNVADPLGEEVWLIEQWMGRL